VRDREPDAAPRALRRSMGRGAGGPRLAASPPCLERPGSSREVDRKVAGRHRGPDRHFQPRRRRTDIATPSANPSSTTRLLSTGDRGRIYWLFGWSDGPLVLGVTITLFALVTGGVLKAPAPVSEWLFQSPGGPPAVMIVRKT
jgi:hypothetical protein